MNIIYVAGFFDGEGCVSFAKNRSGIFPRINVVNTNFEILKSFQKKFGGDIIPLSYRKSNWKQAWSWRLCWTKAVDFLDRLSPYLRIKIEQAETVFAWQAIRPGCGGGKWDKESMELLKARMKFLNHRGLHNEIDPILKELTEEYK